jgi:hypothetical protein
MKKILLLGLLVSLAVMGCVSGDNSFLVQKLDDEGKSQALTAAGIGEYQLYIVRNRDFEQIPRIKEYFSTALRFDPTNAQAQQYLGVIDNYRSQQLKANLASATKLLARQKRTDDEIYQLAVYLNTGASLDGTNATVQKMLSDTAAERAKLVESYLAKTRASLATIDDKTTVAARERAYTDAFAVVSRALDVDPRNAAAQNQLSTIKGVLSKIVAARVDSIQKLVAASKYADARVQVTALNDLNRRAGNAFANDVRAQTYAVNFKWANTLYAQKSYSSAEARIDAALAANRTGEATALKKKLADLRAKADLGASFDAALQEIDRLIGSGDLLAAHRRLDAVANVTSDQAKLGQLDDRDQMIQDGLKPLYDQGVQAYRDEDFKTAIDALQTVVSIRVDYEQAADYLDKAKAKQKLLDTF